MLLKTFLQRPGKRQPDVGWQLAVFLSQGEKDPPVFTKIEYCGKIPKRGQDIVHLDTYPMQFPVKPFWVLDMLHGMRAENVVKLAIFKGKLVDIMELSEVVNPRAMPHDVRIDPASICFATADIQVPFSLAENPFFEQDVTDFVQQIK